MWPLAKPADLSELQVVSVGEYEKDLPSHGWRNVHQSGVQARRDRRDQSTGLSHCHPLFLDFALDHWPGVALTACINRKHSTRGQHFCPFNHRLNFVVVQECCNIKWGAFDNTLHLT